MALLERNRNTAHDISDCNKLEKKGKGKGQGVGEGWGGGKEGLLRKPKRILLHMLNDISLLCCSTD